MNPFKLTGQFNSGEAIEMVVTVADDTCVYGFTPADAVAFPWSSFKTLNMESITNLFPSAVADAANMRPKVAYVPVAAGRPFVVSVPVHSAFLVISKDFYVALSGEITSMALAKDNYLVVISDTYSVVYHGGN